jgi:hypothetical protein
MPHMYNQIGGTSMEKYAGERNLTEYRGELGQAVEQLDLF